METTETGAARTGGCPMGFDKMSFADPAVQRQPYDFYQWLRTNEPVKWDAGINAFVVSTDELIRKIALDWETFSNTDTRNFGFKSEGAEEAAAIRAQTYKTTPLTVQLDPPRHTQFRHIINGVLSPKRMRETKTWIDKLSADLLRKMAEKGGGDFVEEYCAPLPFTVITIMLGLPPEMWTTMRRWADSFTEQFKAPMSRELAIRCAHSYVEYHRYLEKTVNERRAEANPQDDLITGIALAKLDGEPLEMVDVISVLEQFVVAGAETTSSTLGMGGLALARRPDLVEALRGDERAVETYVEEVLRLFAPAQGLFRTVMKDTEVAGVKIPRGAKVMLRWGSANTDEEVYQKAQEIDLNRPNARQHVTFGYGIHKCLGAPLARIELAATYRNMAEHLGSLSLKEDEALEYVQGIIFMGMKKIPMKMTLRA